MFITVCLFFCRLVDGFRESAADGGMKEPKIGELRGLMDGWIDGWMDRWME